MKRIILFFATFAMVLFCGCNEPTPPQLPEQSTLLIGEDGTITEYLIDSFGQSYYSVSELDDMAKEEAKEYNELHKATGTSQVVVDTVEEFTAASVRQVRLKTIYASANTFADYTEQVLFLGTGAEASYLLSDQVAAQYSENQVIVTNAAMVIYPYKQVEAVLGGYPVLADGGVDLTQITEGQKAVIVLKK